MKIAIRTVLLVCLSVLPALCSLTISSASVGDDGRTFAVTMNGTGIAGSTASCFSFSNTGYSTVSGAAASATISGSSTVTVVSSSPAYSGNTINVILAASPTCIMVGSTGSAASSSVIASNASGYLPACDSGWSGKMTVQGGPTCGTDGNGYPNTALGNGTNVSLDFNVSSSNGSFYVWGFAPDAISLYMDGVVQTRNTQSSGYNEYAFTGYDTGAHSFRLVASSSSGYPYFQAFRCPSCSFSTAPVTRPLISVCGASIVDVSGGGAATDNTDQQNWGLLQAIGFTDQGLAASGQTLYTYLRDHCPAAMAPGSGPVPVIGWMEPDPNDINANNALVDVQSAAQTVVTNILANGAPPSGKLFVAGYYPSTYNNSGVCNGLTATQCSALYNGAIAAGVAAAGSSKTVFIHTQALPNGGPDWINSSSPCTGTNGTQEGVHPCAGTTIGAAGYGQIANRQAPLFLGQTLGHSFTVSGPTTGVQGSPSSFTSTIAGSSAGVTWQDIVTVASSVATDQVCIVGGSCGAGSVAIPGALGTSTFSFTVRPATSGARTISYTGLPEGWVSASTSTLTASSPTGTYLIP